MKTWLSGMSPAAAEFASACSADGDGDVDERLAAVVVGAGCVEAAVVATAGAPVLPEPAHQVSDIARGTIDSTASRRTRASSPAAPEHRLNIRSDRGFA